MNIRTQDITNNSIVIPGDIHLGTHIKMDPQSYTSCIDKHIVIESILEGMRVDSVPFDKIIGKLSDLPSFNSIY